MTKRYKLEIVAPNGHVYLVGWFGNKNDVYSRVKFIRRCPIDNGPIKLQMTEYNSIKPVEL